MNGSPAWQLFQVKILIGLIAVAIAVMLGIYLRRARITAAAVDATVGALAVGLRTKRKLSLKGAEFRRRVEERADQPEAPRQRRWSNLYGFSIPPTDPPSGPSQS